MLLYRILLVLCLIPGIHLAQPQKASGVVEKLPVYTPRNADQLIRIPAATYDSNRVWSGSTANLTRKVAVGKNFKGPLDDTLRLVTVQSGGTRHLVIATDTMTIGFFKNGFRIETPYTFVSDGAYTVGVGNVDSDGFTDIVAGLSATPFRLIWFEWDGVNWVSRDSL